MDTTSPPTGTVTFLFTDIEGSTRLWEQHPQAMDTALARHDALLRRTLAAHQGHVFKTIGDAFCVAFDTPAQALAAAADAQIALLGEGWGETGPLRVRMALHLGAAEQREGDYFGPTLNRVARLLAAGHGGQILLSQAVADRVRDQLPHRVSLRNLGTHRLKDLQQPEQILQVLHPGLPADFPPLRSLEAFAHNLPRQLTSFIGREREMVEIQQLLSKTALLTLTGAGGCGKTRLALQVAAELVEAFADGVWFVELAALAPPTSGGYPGLVPQTVATTLGVREQAGYPLMATLAEHLRPRSLLLVLDNCEHLLEGCAQLVVALLQSCPDLRILATSREALGVAGETPWRVPSLSVPDPHRLSSATAGLRESLSQYEAVRLFTERAQTLQAGFVLTSQNSLAVAQVCARLDGIPLALELAAARVKSLPVTQIAEHLDDRFRLLTGGSRTAPPRQQTLRALIDWSYDLLSEQERSLLQRLSVFAGGWTLETAEAVCGGDGIQAWGVLDLLAQLVEKSLVVYEEREGEGRYRLLETVRQYARDRLLAGGAEGALWGPGTGGEAAVIQGRHRDVFLRLAEEAEPKLDGPEQRKWQERLETEHDNLRAALEWCRVEEGGGEAGLRLAGALWRFWDSHGYLVEGLEHLAALLALPEAEAVTEARGKALRVAGLLASGLGDLAASQVFLEEGLRIARELGNSQLIAGSLHGLGLVAERGGTGQRRGTCIPRV